MNIKDNEVLKIGRDAFENIVYSTGVYISTVDWNKYILHFVVTLM
jgi:hypothetical protein